MRPFGAVTLPLPRRGLVMTTAARGVGGGGGCDRGVRGRVAVTEDRWVGAPPCWTRWPDGAGESHLFAGLGGRKTARYTRRCGGDDPSGQSFTNGPQPRGGARNTLDTPLSLPGSRPQAPGRGRAVAACTPPPPHATRSVAKSKAADPAGREQPLWPVAPRDPFITDAPPPIP